MKKALRAAIAAVLLTAAMLAPLGSAALARSVALVIGNADYAHAPRLLNPVHDAEDVSAALRGLGFDVTLLLDVDQAAFIRGLSEFQTAAAAADVAVIYFAGHGLGVDGETWLAPTDAALPTQDSVELQTIALRQVLAAVRGARRLRLVVLDACRNNPFRSRMVPVAGRTRQISRGLALIEPGGDTLVWYAAKDGSFALDGDGRNSPFTTAFLKHLQTPGLELGKLFREIVADVRVATREAQTPWAYGTRGREDFFFVPALETASTGGPSGDQAALDLAMTIEDPATRAAALEAFLRTYPGSPLRAAAEQALAETKSDAPILGAAPSFLDAQTARAWDKARRDGDLAAITHIASLYAQGRRGFPKDEGEAVRLFQIAAERGYADAQVKLGAMYLLGGGGLRADARESVRLFRIAAEQNNPLGLANLGYMYANGLGGLRKDEREAVRLFSLAADLGGALGQAYLGSMYAQGLGGLPQDHREAVRLFRASAAQGVRAGAAVSWSRV